MMTSWHECPVPCRSDRRMHIATCLIAPARKGMGLPLWLHQPDVLAKNNAALGGDGYR